MNVLYVFGSEAELSSTFIKREILELKKNGLGLYFLIINPFFRQTDYTRELKIFKAGINPITLLINPLINYFFYNKSILFSSYKYSISKGFDKKVVKPYKIFFATILIESALTKLVRSGIKINHIHSHHLFSATLFTNNLAETLGSSYSISLHTLSYYINLELLKKTIEEAAFLRTISNETNIYFQSRYSNKNYHLIPNGIDLKPTPKKNIPFQLSILAIGKLLDKKGLDILIKSCKIINDKQIDFKCKIVGDGPEKKSLENLIAKNNLQNKISLVPYKDFSELIPLFQDSSVVAVPSRNPKNSTRDGLPTVILEAMALGIPVVASNFAGISDAIIHEKTGLLVEPEDEQDLANSILKIYFDRGLAAKFIENSNNLIQQKFSLQKNISQLAELFHQQL